MDNEIRKVLISLIKKFTPMQVIAAKVTSVDEDQSTCDCEPAEGGPMLHDVRLRSSIDGIQEGIIPLPTIGSYVLIGLINNEVNQCYIVNYTSISKITIKCDDIRLNGESNGGIPIIQSLVDKINRLENSMTNHQHIYVDGPGVGALITTQHPSQLITPITQVTDLENTNVKHG